ncbi:hypothetical protein BC830DRAFT_1167687 [Chytriomyces sp. MP71]|nr:hypothetical protein BC830DRAFT_1167687 [Chytriomyces sp. MP71]
MPPPLSMSASSNSGSSLAASASSLAPPSALSQPQSPQSLPTRAVSNKTKWKKPSQREKKGLARASNASLKLEDPELALQLEASMIVAGASSSATGAQVNKRGEISLNHLINFSFPAREAPQAPVTAASRRKRSSYVVPFNKEKFINANYRFLMKPAPYTTHLRNPDSPLPWNQILEIVIPHLLHTQPTCPICDYGNCPVCTEYVYSKDARCVLYHGVEEWSQGYNGHLVLMKRGLTSTIALPNTSYTTVTRSPPHNCAPLQPFAHLLLATKESHTAHLGADRTALGRLLNDLAQEERAYRVTAAATGNKQHADLATQAATEKRYADLALGNVKRALEEADASSWEMDYEGDGVNVVPGYVPPKEGSRARKGSRNRVGGVDGRKRSPVRAVEGENAPGFGEPRGRSVSPSENGKQAVNLRTGQPSAEYYYFYQAHDGQHMYLHPLDIKILKQEFQEYDKFPNEIVGKVLHVQESTMTEDLRKRCKYLGHLPLSCDVNFCEMDLSSVVSAETLKLFEKELTQRAKAHETKKEKESLSVKDKAPEFETASITSSSYRSSPRLESTSPNQGFSSSWEDPSLFDSLFPAAVPDRSSSEDTHNIHLTVPSGAWGLAARTSTSSFASAAAKSSGKPVSFLPRRGSRFATLNTDAMSDDEVREYRFHEEAWVCDFAIEEDPLDGSGEVGLNASKGKKSKKKKGVVLVSNGGKRGGL